MVKRLSNTKNKSLFSYVKYLIGWPLSLIALVFVFKVIFLNSSKILGNITNFNPYLLTLSIIFFVLYFFLRGYLWMLILGEKAKHFSFKENLLYWSVSELKRYVPGSVWAFASRTSSFEKEDLSKKQILVFLAHEGILVCISSLIFSLFYLLNFTNNLILNNLTLLGCIFLSFIFIFGAKLLTFYKNDNKLKKTLYFLLPNNSSFDNFKIYLLGIFTFFIFGIASYLSAVSLFYIDLRYVLTVISLFAFSYLVGYLSIITPMGLGVREGVTTFGLLPYLANSLAATTSIFVRTVSIIAEIISIGIIVAINKIKNNKLQKLENFCYNHKQELILCFFVFIYIAYFTFATFLRYDNFYTGRFDLGNMDQTVWNTLNGRIFELTDPDGIKNISRLSVHADFILILISPLYLIWSNPKMLLLLQTILLGFGAFGVFVVAKEVLKNKQISLALSTAFLLNPAVQFTNLYDFHPVTLATTLLLWTFYFFLKKKYLPFLVCAILAGITKEEVWAIIAIFGIFIAGRSFLENKKITKEFLLGFTLFLFGSILFYTLIAKIIPAIRGGDHFALSYYSDFGDSAQGIVKSIILNPVKTFSTLFEHTRIAFLSELLLPLSYLSLLSPLLLVFSLPDLLINLLSNNPQLHQIYYQYSSTITPFIFISAIFSCKLILDKFKKINFQLLSIYILIVSFIALYNTGPLPGSKRPNIDMFTKQLGNRIVIKNAIDSIPKNLSVASTNNLGSHLSSREKIYSIPYGMDKADVIVFLLERGYSEFTYVEQLDMINNLKNNPQFYLKFEDKDFYQFIRKN